MKNTLALEIQNFMSLAKMSARGLARKAGISSPSTITNILAGRRKSMSFENAEKIRAVIANLSLERVNNPPSDQQEQRP